MSRMTVGKLERKMEKLKNSIAEWEADSETTSSHLNRATFKWWAGELSQELTMWQEKRDRMVARTYGISIETVRAIDNAVLSLERAKKID